MFTLLDTSCDRNVIHITQQEAAIQNSTVQYVKDPALKARHIKIITKLLTTALLVSEMTLLQASQIFS